MAWKCDKCDYDHMTCNHNLSVLPSGYSHRFVTRDGPMSTDRMLGLVILAAHRAWEKWCSTADVTVQGISPELDAAMQYLRREIGEAEIFLSGVAQGRQELKR
jgi:hypothetical protein